jgi:hypothetical protein
MDQETKDLIKETVLLALKEERDELARIEKEEAEESRKQYVIQRRHEKIYDLMRFVKTFLRYKCRYCMFYERAMGEGEVIEYIPKCKCNKHGCKIADVGQHVDPKLTKFFDLLKMEDNIEDLSEELQDSFAEISGKNHAVVYASAGGSLIKYSDEFADCVFDKTFLEDGIGLDFEKGMKCFSLNEEMRKPKEEPKKKKKGIFSSLFG